MNAIKRLPLFILAIMLFAFTYSENNETKPMLVVIDVAHGGKDSGFEFGGVKEKEIVKDIADRIVALNGNSNLKIVLNRTEDTFISLSERVSSINTLKPDAVVSLHINGSPKDDTNSGFEVYTSGKSLESQKLAEVFQKEFHSYKAGDKIAVKEAGFYILKNIEAPAVVLEMGFLTNEKDRKIILSNTGREEIARFVLKSLQNFN
jgi:N-acetylmuramoyl-L-alanine amidase